MRRLLVCVLAIAASAAWSQTPVNYLTITTANANEIPDASGVGITGRYCAYATDATDSPIAFSVNGAYQAVKSTVCVPVAAGQFSGILKLANPAVTQPSGIRYHVTVTNTVTNQVTQYPGVTITVAAGVSSWDWSTWNPAIGVASIPTNIIVGPTGAAGPNCNVSSPPGTCDLGTEALAAGTASLVTAPPVGSFHVAACCDSLTQGVGATTSYPAALTANIGVSVSNLGSCGQTALQAALRIGALTATVTVVGGSIPTSGNVQVTFSPVSPVDSCNGPSVISTITGAGGVVVAGTLSEIGGLDYFTPSTYPTSPLTVAAGSPWAPVVGERFLGYMIIWAGRNGISRSDNLSSIAAIAGMMSDKKKTLVLSVENQDVPSEYSGGSDYTTITSLNSSLQSIYSGTTTYPDNYLDIRAYLVSQYDPTSAQDVIDHGHDVPPASLRPVKTSTFLGAVTTTTQTTVLVSNTDMSTIITATGEKMEISSFSGSVSPFTATVIRGYAGTTPSTYLNGDSFQFIEPLHYSDAGYALIAGQVYTWLRNHATPVSPLSGMFDLLHELPLSGSANAAVTTAPKATDLNLQTSWPWVGWADGTTLNTPGSGTWYVVTTGLACCTGLYASQLATSLTTGALQSRSLNNGTWTPWASGLSVGSITTGVGPVTADLNAQTSWPWVGWADNTTLHTPGTGSWLVSTTGLGCCSGYVSQMATGLTTGAVWTRADNNGTWSTWSQPSNPPAMAAQFLSVASISPAAASATFIGMGGLARTTLSSAMPWEALQACIVSAVHYNQNVTGTLDTGANNFTFKVYDFTTSTAFADTAATLTAQAVQQGVSVTTANDSVAAGDKLGIQVTAPGSYTTTPTAFYWSANVLCK